MQEVMCRAYSYLNDHQGQENMSRFAWIIAMVPLMVLALRLTVFDPNTRNLSCVAAQNVFEMQDFSSSLPRDVILLTGNQRIKHWSSSPKKLGDSQVLKRTVEGLTPELLNTCFPRLIGHYQPSRVLLFLDTLHTSTVDSGALLASLEGIMEQRSVYGLRFDLWVVAPITSPRLSSADRENLRRLISEVSEWSEQMLGTHWVSLNEVLEDDAEGTNPHYFWPNGNTLTQEGYQLITQRLITVSEERNKEFTGIVSP
jgi:hypothetical protein